MNVTILTPTLNAARHLSDCLASVQAQVQPRLGIEHLVLDGGSSDGTVELARAAGAQVRVERDGSLYEALNRGIDGARGDVIGWLNADDAFEPGALEQVARTFDRSTGADVVVGDYVMASPGERRVVHARADALARIRLGRRRGTWVTPLAVFFRAASLRSLGPYLARYRVAADLDMWLRAAARRPFLTVAHAGAVLGTFRVHAGSLSAGADPRRSLAESMEIARRWYEDASQGTGVRRYALFVYRRYAYQLRAWEARDERAAARALAALACVWTLSRLGPGVLGDVRTAVTP